MTAESVTDIAGAGGLIGTKPFQMTCIRAGGTVGEAATMDNTCRPGSGTDGTYDLRTGLVVGRTRRIPVQAPLENIAVRIIEPPAVGLQQTDLLRTFGTVAA